ncbi:MAG TPA: glutamine-hydrolyzing GMP synthase [Thermomicrobiales bacterium]|jgi:GMP synthase (glutamine-hydrolysing)|nr:glutamine-hydrolyzing GMP synthase [Thermomicrobiales bacterium]
MKVSTLSTIARAGDEGSIEPGFDTVVVLDFGSQYSQLIARRIREAGVYSILLPWDTSWEEIARLRPKGIILSGGPASVYDEGAPSLPAWVLREDVPVLGICYGMQLIASALDGGVEPATRREYGPAKIEVTQSYPLFRDLPASLDVWMSHGDHVTRLPTGYVGIARSSNAPIAGMTDGRRYGIQFHPEVVHTPLGRDLLRNFLVDVCNCRTEWTAEHFIDSAVRQIRETVGDGRVLLGLSGGVDSSVAAALIHRAIGDRLMPVFVDNGLLRLGEADLVRDVFGRAFGMNLVFVDASERFLDRLEGVADPEEKRRIVGDEFIRTFESQAAVHGPFDFLAQGTLYPDVIESTAPDTKSAMKIKTHHNVGGLPTDLTFSLVEPLRYLFKDEVREVGRALGLPAEIVERQPFPGPGLAVRIIGEITRNDLELLRRADAVVREEVDGLGDGTQVWQYFAVLLPVRTVGVMGDYRTYGRVCAVRAVTSEDAMTADWARLPYDALARISNRIVNEVDGITRVVYDVSSKPPATIEWE